MSGSWTTGARVASIAAAICIGATATAPAAAGGLDWLIPAGTTIGLGAQAVVQPKYEGGKNYEVFVVPTIKFGPGGSPFGSAVNIDVQSLDDIGIGILNIGGLSVGPAIGYRLERKESDGRLLHGLGDVEGGLLLGGFARYDWNPVYIRASYLTQVTGDDNGGVLRLQAGADYTVDPRLQVKTFAAVEFGDDDYMQNYFGVTAAQSLRSGLRRYDVDAGAKSFHLGLSADYEVFPTWTVTAGVEYVRLLGDAANSPVVEEENQFVGRIGLAKSFTLGQ